MFCINYQSNQGNQSYSGNQKIQGQRPDMENRHTQQRTQGNQNYTYKVTKVNEQLGLNFNKNWEHGPGAPVG